MYGEVFGYVPEEALGEWKKRLEFGSKKRRKLPPEKNTWLVVKIQGTYFKISALYFKIYGLYFSPFQMSEKQYLAKAPK